MAVEVTLALGTNLGDRQENIRVALNLLDIALGSPHTAITPVIETEACGFEGPCFLNCLVRYRTAKSPDTLLKICKFVERQMGRTDGPEYAPDGSRIYHDRIIDIDILFYGDRKVNTPRLRIPHPQVHGRPYVKRLLKMF